METAPLLRVSLVGMGPERHRLVISNHHILLDGWSMPVLLDELFRLYRGETLAPAPSYRTYLAWLAGQDREGARAAWAAALAGLEEPSRFMDGRLADVGLVDVRPATGQPQSRRQPASMGSVMYRCLCPRL